jgi:hypothetical protein
MFARKVVDLHWSNSMQACTCTTHRWGDVYFFTGPTVAQIAGKMCICGRYGERKHMHDVLMATVEWLFQQLSMAQVDNMQYKRNFGSLARYQTWPIITNIK